MQVALHVLRQHQYRPPGDDGRGAAMQETIHDRRLSIEQDPDDLRMWLKIDTRLHGAAAESGEQQVRHSCRPAAKMTSHGTMPHPLHRRIIHARPLLRPYLQCYLVAFDAALTISSCGH